MSYRTRGQEIAIRVAVDGQVQGGSFIKVTEFNYTPRTDLNEEDYLGELESDLDIQHHGYDLNFTIHEEDAAALQFLSTIVDRERRAEVHPEITITVIRTFRKPGVQNVVEVFHGVFLKVSEQGFSGRREHVSTSFEGKAKKRELVSS